MQKDFIQNNDQSDDTDSEEVQARIGRIPFKWYDSFNHMGYDINSQKIQKQQQDGVIDAFINRSENKNWWRTIKDELNQKNIVLTDEQLSVLQRIRSGKFADKKIAETDYQVEYDWTEGMFPLSAAPKSKRSFLPSKNERIMINKLVQAIKMGRIKPKQEEEPEEILTDVWEHEEIANKKSLPPITAPKIALPTHAESYNPSAEYILDKEETKNYLEMDEEDRPMNYLPRSHPNLRSVSAYPRLLNERFDRCLDLYLSARVVKRRLQMTQEQLMPKLPKPNELRPFPTQANITYEGHQARITAISVEYTGQFVASCDESGLLLIFEIQSSRIQERIQFADKCTSLDWHSNGLLLVASGSQVYVVQPNCLDTNNDEMIERAQKVPNSSPQFINIQIHNPNSNEKLSWTFPSISSSEYLSGIRIVISCLENDIHQVTWHSKGDYFASLAPKAEKRNEQVFVHSMNKAESQKPFQKSKGNIQKVMFHSKKPIMFLVTNKNTYLYNLQQQAMGKKLVSGAQINSCMAIHPLGDNIIVGTHDRRVCWFDLDLDNKPYKTFRYHEAGVNSCDFHRRYPLFASCSEDGTIHIFHATVYSDLMQNALIVPLKILKTTGKNKSIADIKFHPTQPWIFSGGNDHKLTLWT